MRGDSWHSLLDSVARSVRNYILQLAMVGAQHVCDSDAILETSWTPLEESASVATDCCMVAGTLKAMFNKHGKTTVK